MKIIENEEEAELARMTLNSEINNNPVQEGEGAKQKLLECYEFISSAIRYYLDISEEKINLVALWIIGTYFHDKFQTFPYLFLNAMRGSGKTRLLRLISMLSKNGQLVNSITDAVLFRTTGALCLDEFEGIGRKKENESLKELLNSGYKKGTKVFRMKKKKTIDGETQVVEEFQPYRSIAMANIWGMEEVLGDRCIQLTLEKSDNIFKTKLIENYESLDILPIKAFLEEVSVVLCSVVMTENLLTAWNEYLLTKNIENTTLNNIHTYKTHNYTKLHSYRLNEEIFLPIAFFDKIIEMNIDGRNLELFFPLFLIAFSISEEVLTSTMTYAKQVIEDRKMEEITESKDVLLYSLISKQKNEWTDISTLTQIFRLIMGEGEADWLNPKWMGRALKRLCLVAKKRRTSSGIQVILDIEKAKRKEKMFRNEIDFLSTKSNSSL